ncbi:hypothetical protein [uncultured Jatrophihabitans sp.]|uniref:hypothetical protein n=1 Tax=uncultured Jatrophihabitans sp. TaxID=1610747 RepID=UPI0035CA4F08
MAEPTRTVTLRVPALERRRHLTLVPSPTDTSLTAAATRPPSNLTAAAVHVDVTNPPAQPLWGASPWQNEAWDHYDSCPELHRAVTDMAEAFSRAVMIVVDVDPQSGELGQDPTDNPTAGAIGAAMFGGRVGQAQAQRAAAQHLTVPGEYYVLASEGADIDDDPWQTLSAAEVSKTGSTIQVTRLDTTRRTLQPGELLFRVWQPHPRWRWQADSPSRAALDPLREIAGLSAQIMASIRSRLATAGVWLLPQSAQLPPDRDETGAEIPGTGGGADAWLRKIATAMVTAISDPQSPAALAPIIAMIPDELLDKIKDPFQFVRDVITEAQTLRDAAVRRLAIGMDMPPERLLGIGTTNHWSAWNLDESFVKGPLSSLLSVPADAYTRFWLRPALRFAGLDPKLFAIAFDVSAMLADIEVDNAVKAYGEGALSERKFLEVLGFDPDRDAAGNIERARRLVLTVLARGNPDTLAELLPMLQQLFPGFKLTVPVVPAGTSPDAPAAPDQSDVQRAIEPPSTTDTHQPPPRPTAPPAPPVTP